ncbi:sulfurtransferase TusA [Marinospirillum insulare]|uniref:Sulfurtransferase TusD n=1 Tax=Marinospirillum insulare TaxID=217169 RepID=A0ABQ5ZWB4_9GAMM|nr:sulfurtransferase TusA [Marinospirillum insulare]GLR64294.1 sulfurtransferase TusD [Marinospirillum insulare]
MNKAVVEHQHLLDTSGLYCPEPIMLLHKKLDEMLTGEVLLLIATDPATTRDVPKFCQFLKHNLVDQQEDQQHYRYWLKKA